jgi:hypothetical protein
MATGRDGSVIAPIRPVVRLADGSEAPRAVIESALEAVRRIPPYRER